MAIETLQDYNAQSCCCPQILCPIPEEVCESKTVTTEAVGWTFASWRSAVGVIWEAGFDETDIPCPDSARAYRHVVQTDSYTSTDPEYEPSTNTLDVTVDPGATYNIFGYPTPNTQIGSTFTGGPVDSYSGGVFSGTSTNTSGEYTETGVHTVTFSDPVDGALLLSEALAALESEEWAEGETCSATNVVFYKLCDDAPTEELDSAEFVAIRTRWQIPATWTDPVTGLTVPFPGTYFKITYDILEEPTGWDDESPTVFRSFVSVDNVLEWTGPGTGDADDPSWLLPWITIDPPTVPGTRRIVNRRLVCREDWGLGVLPQVWGEAVTLPDPEP